MGYIDTTIQHGYPDSYSLAVLSSIPFSSPQATGPNINKIWQAHETHALVELSTRPIVGDKYTIIVLNKDGTSQEKEFVVENINDNFSFINYPANNETITTETPVFVWSETTSIVSQTIMVAEINGQEENWIWSIKLPSDKHSAAYNFDGLASASLEPGKTYLILIHNFDNKGNQATTSSTFFISNP